MSWQPNPITTTKPENRPNPYRRIDAVENMFPHSVSLSYCSAQKKGLLEDAGAQDPRNPQRSDTSPPHTHPPI